jgi:DNA-binding response OmpR family regulator
MNTILIVEDSHVMQRTLRRLFESYSLQVQIASDGPSGLTLFRQQLHCAVILDLKVPGMPGRELCREFKALAPSVPIVVVSANAAVQNKVLLLEMGPDDYVTKPFSPKELLARVRRTIRRAEFIASPVMQLAVGPVNHEVQTFGNARVDFAGMEASLDGKPVSLTAHEFNLLNYLYASAERVISREELLRNVWGYENYPSTRAVDNHVVRLRQKLEPDPAAPRYFLTIHGAGYKFIPGGLG